MQKPDLTDISYQDGYDKGKREGVREVIEKILKTFNISNDKDYSININIPTLLHIATEYGVTMNSGTVILYENANRCVCCGDIIPEDMHICKSCGSQMS